jgi:hypothetical protein
MSEPPPDIDSQEWAWVPFRCHVFELIGWGFRDAEQDIRKMEHEEDITGLIRKAIRKKLDSDPSPRLKYYSVHNEDPVDDLGTLGKNRPRVDILFEYGGTRPRLRYSLEAKRCARVIHKSRYTIKWYAEGIAAFLAGTYATDSPEGGLLGLIQSDDEKFWTSELARLLEADVSLACKTPLAESQLITDMLDVALSRHQRKDGSDIDLYHAFLDCKKLDE